MNLIDKINSAASVIHKASLNNNANYVVCSKEFAEAIQDLDIKRQRKKKLLQIEKRQNLD